MLEDQLLVVACGSYLPRLSLQSVRRKGLQPEVRYETDTCNFPNISLCTFNLHIPAQPLCGAVQSASFLTTLLR